MISKIYVKYFGRNLYLLVLFPVLIFVSINCLYGVANQIFQFHLDFDLNFVNMLAGIIMIILQQWNTVQLDLYKEISIGYCKYMKYIMSFETEFLSNLQQVEVDKKVEFINHIKLIQQNTENLVEHGNECLNGKGNEILLFDTILNIKDGTRSISKLGGVCGTGFNHIFDEINLMSDMFIEIKKVDFKYPNIFYYDLTYVSLIVFLFLTILTIHNKFYWWSIPINMLIVYMTFGLAISSHVSTSVFIRKVKNNIRPQHEYIASIKNAFNKKIISFA
jgi:hypothetical protein